MNFMSCQKLNIRASSIYISIEIAFSCFFVLGVRFFYFSALSVPFFWFGYLTLSLLTILSISSKSSVGQKLLSVFVYSLSIHFIVPLIQPVGVPLDHDALYTVQAVRAVQKGHWIPGQGTGDANLYSLYPILLLTEVFLCHVTGVDVFILQQFLMLIFSPVFLMGMFLFIKKTTGDSDLAIISTFFFATNPIINAMTSKTAYQGLGYVFVSLVLLLFSFKSKKGVFLFLVFSTVLAMTHHLSSYNAIFFLIVVTFCVGILKTKSTNFNMQTNNGKLLFLIIVVASWTMLVAVSMASGYINVISALLQGSLHLQTAMAGELTGSFVGESASLIDKFFEYLGVAVVVCFGLLGSIASLTRRVKFEVYMFLVGIGISLLSFFVLPWQVFGGSRELRSRVLDWAYLYLVPATVIGAIWFKDSVLQRIGKSGLYIFVLVLLLLTPATILAGLPKLYYTGSSPLERSNFGLVDGSKWLATAKWISQFIPVKTVIWSGGVGENYISGAYGRVTEPFEYFFDQFSSYSSGAVVIHNLMISIGGLSYNLTLADLQRIQARLNCVYNDGPIGIYTRRTPGPGGDL